MKRNLYTLIYASVLGTVCALLLTAAAQVTGPRYQANKEAEKNRHILHALGVPLAEDATAARVLETFEENVRAETLGDLTLFVYRDPEAPDKVLALAVPFAGPGLWGPVKGFLALEPDRTTIRGITFYEHEETPGLGGEIEAPWFKEQFVGKRIEGADGRAGMKILMAGGSRGVNEVNGITGATLTCNKVQAMLNDAIQKIIEEAKSNG